MSFMFGSITQICPTSDARPMRSATSPFASVTISLRCASYERMQNW